MGHIHAQPLDPHQQRGIGTDHSSGIQGQLEELLDSLELLPSKKKRTLAELSKSITTLSKTLDSPKNTAHVLDLILELDPDALDGQLDDLKDLRKKNKKATVSDLFTLKNQVLLAVPTSGTASSAISAKLASSSIATELSKDPTMTPEFKKNLSNLASFGYSFKDSFEALERFPILSTALGYLIANDDDPSIWEVLEKYQKTPPVATQESIAEAEEDLRPIVQKAAHETDINATIVDPEAVAYYNHLMAKPVKEWTLGDMTGMAVCLTEIRHSSAPHLLVSSSADTQAITKALNADRPRFKVTTDLGPDQIKELIQAMMLNGLNSVDDLHALLQLLGDLGFSADLNLMNAVTETVQNFVDTFAASTSDPLEILTLISMIQDFSQSDLGSELNLDHISAEIAELIAAEPSSDSQISVAHEAAAMGLDIVLPTQAQEKIDSTRANDAAQITPTSFAEQQAGAQRQPDSHRKSIQPQAPLAAQTKNITPSINRVTKIDSAPTLKPTTDRPHDVQEKTQEIFEKLAELVDTKRPELDEKLNEIILSTLKRQLDGLLSNFAG